MYRKDGVPIVLEVIEESV